MEINYTINENGYITSWTQIPFDPTLPFIEVENPNKEIILGYTKLVNGKLVTDKKKYDKDKLIDNIKYRREVECFAIVNRGQVWYNTLSKTQKTELQNWYEAWLDAPQTLVIPEKPEWL